MVFESELMAAMVVNGQLTTPGFIALIFIAYAVSWGIVVPVYKVLLYAFGYALFRLQLTTLAAVGYPYLLLIVYPWWVLRGVYEGTFRRRRIWVTPSLTWIPPFKYCRHGQDGSISG